MAADAGEAFCGSVDTVLAGLLALLAGGTQEEVTVETSSATVNRPIAVSAGHFALLAHIIH